MSCSAAIEFRNRRNHFPHTTTDEFLFWLFPFPQDALLEGWRIAADASVASVRTNERPYVAGENYTTVIDGFIVSPNVSVEEVRGFDLGFCPFRSPTGAGALSGAIALCDKVGQRGNVMSKKPGREHGLTRRKALAALGVTGAAAACAQEIEAPPYTGALSFNHGVASGDPDRDRARDLDARDAGEQGPVPVRWVVARNRELT